MVMIQTHKLWYWLTEPKATVQSPEHRYNARLLASLLVTILPVGFLVAIVPPLIDPAQSVWTDWDGISVMGGSIFWAIAYTLARLGRYRLATGLASGVACVVIFLAGMFDTEIEELNYIVMPVLLSSLLLPIQVTVLMALLSMAAMVLIPLFNPYITLAEAFVGPISFVGIGSALILLASRHRDLLEQNRQARLVESETRYRHLFEETQATLAETEALYHASRAAIVIDSLPNLLQTIADKVAAALPATWVALITLDMEARQSTDMAISGPKAKITRTGSFDELMDGLTGWAVRHQKPALSSKERPDPRESPAVQQHRRESGFGSIVVVPLQYRGKILGTMTAVNRRDERDFTRRDVRLMVSLASHAAVAIENARLYEQARQELAEREQAEAQLQASLKEKEVLLKEIHHRVKNNLQIISSLLNLQSAYIEDSVVLEILQESQNRVRSMALIHEKLYRSQNLAQIDFGDYIRELAAFLFRAQNAYHRGIALDIQAEQVFLPIDDAVPCALILNELVSNALKHAFPNGQTGTVSIQLAVKDRRLTLRVSDTGAGFPPNLDFRNTESLGLQLVITLVDQLEGDINLYAEHGTAFEISFETKMAQPPTGRQQQ